MRGPVLHIGRAMTRRTRFAVAFFTLLAPLLAPVAVHAGPAADGSCADAATGGTGSTGNGALASLAAIGAAIAEAIAALPPAAARAPVTADDYASHWAPVWYQDTDSSRPWADYITGVDFDGDWQGDNNWDNLEKGKGNRSAKIYSSVVETETHVFLTYADFHAQDWEEICKVPVFMEKDGCHENDMEGAMLVIRKDGSRFGKLELMATQAHGHLYLTSNDPRITSKGVAEISDAPIVMEGGSHPQLFSQAKGHGVCAAQDGRCGQKTGGRGAGVEFPGGDGVVYRVGEKGETPSSRNDRDVAYELVSLEETLWARRTDICEDGCLFGRGFKAAGGETIGAAFDGGDHADDVANPPWTWHSYGSRGTDFFVRPAETIQKWVNLPGPVSTTYLRNPYLPAS